MREMVSPKNVRGWREPADSEKGLWVPRSHVDTQSSFYLLSTPQLREHFTHECVSGHDLAPSRPHTPHTALFWSSNPIVLGLTIKNFSILGAGQSFAYLHSIVFHPGREGGPRGHFQPSAMADLAAGNTLCIHFVCWQDVTLQDHF